MTSHPEWDRTLDSLATQVQAGMSVEDARETFASIHGFYPHTGERYQGPRRSPISGYVNGEHPWFGRAMAMMWGGTLLLIALMVVIALWFSGQAHADPWCGDGFYYDYRHQVCQSFPTPPPPEYYHPWEQTYEAPDS